MCYTKPLSGCLISSFLATMVELVDRIPMPPPSPKRHWGRARSIRTVVLNALLIVLGQPMPEIHILHALLMGWPSRRSPGS
jgi:hypothetical protein